MEFLVSIKIQTPHDLPQERFQDLLSRERIRGNELKEQGHIARIWRIPGTRNNVGIWQAADANELHTLVSSLPLFAFMSVEVTPLAVHPLEEDKK
ncbi:unannotated protein [freshwater metagenome]|jgi:muconolactone D-isomerase|uniref:muconolactone Delta-isomerase n=1 Tax=freshwater metagenome TaxID=449393 RepID=A0A6J7HTZ9_9ZZZZ|nr:muconolactone delta-isomerase [Actinomycetota bacterium]